MSAWHVSWNRGMTLAIVLLAVGAGLVFVPGEDDRSLHAAGLGIVLLSAVTYIIARVTQFMRERGR